MEQMYWIWGAGRKSTDARAEAERVLGQPSGSFGESWRSFRKGRRRQPPLYDIPPDALQRLRARARTAPVPTQFFGAPSLAEMAGGLLTRTRAARQRASHVVFEDHGLAGSGPDAQTCLFFGRDGVTLRSLPRFRRDFERVGEALAPGAEVFLMHCYGANDGCRLAQAISGLMRVPVYAASGLQEIGNRRMEGEIYRAESRQVRQVRSYPRAVVHFD